jgi:hypothetical protein
VSPTGFNPQMRHPKRYDKQLWPPCTPSVWKGIALQKNDLAETLALKQPDSLLDPTAAICNKKRKLPTSRHTVYLWMELWNKVWSQQLQLRDLGL